jgi:hypothetical protein
VVCCTGDDPKHPDPPAPIDAWETAAVQYSIGVAHFEWLVHCDSVADRRTPEEF